MQVKGRMLDARMRADIAAEFEAAIVDVLVAKSLAALEQCGVAHLVVAGGVGANVQLRARLHKAAARGGFSVYFPPTEFCTDNGAMIAFAAVKRLEHASRLTPHASLSFSVRPRWNLGALAG
jgi:N6-L-threonylcarbamoyladenine synthase